MSRTEGSQVKGSAVSERGEAIEKELDSLIKRRGVGAKKNGQDAELEEMWKASERRDTARRRQENRALWYEFHMRLSDAHTAISREHEAKALALLEGPEKTA